MPDPTQEVTLSTVQPVSLTNFDGGSIEDEFQEKMREIADYLGLKDNKGTCTINIQLTFKRHDRAGFVESTASINSKIPAHKRANILMAREGKIVQDVTTPDATQPGLWDRSKDKAEAKK